MLIFWGSGGGGGLRKKELKIFEVKMTYFDTRH